METNDIFLQLLNEVKRDIEELKESYTQLDLKVERALTEKTTTIKIMQWFGAVVVGIVAFGKDVLSYFK